MSNNILTEIVNSRRASLSRLGHEQGLVVPAQRCVPLKAFPQGALICEVKRKSPSRGSFAMPANITNTAHKGAKQCDTQKNGELCIEALVKTYVKAGVKSVSVLTEPAYFGGSLNDLMRIKNAHPQLSVLRKDFLLDEEDIEVSYRAGCDAVLLMASVLDNLQLSAMYRRAQALHLTALVEVHNEEEASRVFSCIAQPELVGVNCRDLTSFALDKLTPLRVMRSIARAHKNTARSYVYESALFEKSDVRFARECGCNTMLIGEAAVKHPERIGLWNAAAKDAHVRSNDESWFWNLILNARTLAHRVKGQVAPLVKICGLCHGADVRAAVEAGADLLGFVLAESKRQTTPNFIQSVRAQNLIPPHIPAVGVIVGTPRAEHMALVNAGSLQALQIHVPHNARDLTDYNELLVPWYRAVSLKDENSVEQAHKSGSPRTLLDAYSPMYAGGSGQEANQDLVKHARALMPLWLAGGLTPDNVASAVKKHKPELVDVASGVEEAPGVKSHAKLRAFVESAKLLA